MRVNVVQAWNDERRFALGAGGDACGTFELGAEVDGVGGGDVHIGEVQSSMRWGMGLRLWTGEGSSYPSPRTRFAHLGPLPQGARGHGCTLVQFIYGGLVGGVLLKE